MDRLRGAIEGGALSRSGELTLIGVPEIFAPLPPVPWLVEGLDKSPGAVNLIAGYGFTGKTIAAQALALAIASGGCVWDMFTARSGRVLHLDYEQGQRLTNERYQRLARGSKLDPNEVGDRLVDGHENPREFGEVHR